MINTFFVVEPYTVLDYRAKSINFLNIGEFFYHFIAFFALSLSSYKNS